MKFVERVTEKKVISHPLHVRVCYLFDRVLRYGCLIYTAFDLPEEFRVNGLYSPSPIANFGGLAKNNSKYSPTLQ